MGLEEELDLEEARVGTSAAAVVLREGVARLEELAEETEEAVAETVPA